MKIPVDIILFDNDGTLFDSSKGVIQGVRYACEEFKRATGVPIEIPSLKRILELTGAPADKFFPALLPDGYKQRAEDLREVSLKYEIEAIKEKGQLFEGVTLVLSRLKDKGKKLAVLTNAGKRYISAVSEKFNYKSYFDVIGSIELNPAKNKVELARLLSETLGGGRMAVVGDKFADMFSAKQNYALAVFASYGFGNEKDAILADFVINSPMELLEILD